MLRRLRRGDLVTQLNAQVQYLQLQNARLASDMKKKETKSRLMNQLVQPMNRLLDLYVKRADLQSAFPEVKNGDYLRLLEWARDVLTHRNDGAYSVLTYHDKWYRENEWLKLADELRRIQALESEAKIEAAQRVTMIQALESEAKIEATQRVTMIHALESERNALIEEVNKQRITSAQLASTYEEHEAEIEGIRRSFGFKVMRFYGSRFDRYFPENTRRGQFKAIIVQSFRITADQGARSFLKLAGQKLRRGELRIVPTTPSLKYEEHGSAISKQEVTPSLATIPKAWVLAHCDFPELSPNPVAVSDMIAISGWAIARDGIDRVDIYLDDAYVGPAMYGAARPDILKAYPAYPGAEDSGFGKIIGIDREGRKKHTLKIIARTKEQFSLTLEGKLEVSENVLIENVLVEAQPNHTRLRPKGPTSSVIILTKTPPPDFDQTLQGLRRQVGIADPEIIIINSGGSDLSDLSEKYRANVLNISAEEFHHSSTRNLGAETATADYVFYMSDDAIPASNWLLSSMIKLLESDKNVAAATARQIARSDADLMACQALWEHYRMLNLRKDRVVGTAHFDELTATERRQICQIDDVCSCYRRDILLKYKFARVSYAEDLELGIRLVRDGYKLAQLYSTGVIHSHNRPPNYYLKRTYIDVKTLSGLIEYDLTIRHDSLTLPAILESIICLYNALSSAIDDLKEHALYGGDISWVLSSIEKQMKSSRTTIIRESSENEISNFLDQIASVARVNLTREPRQNIYGERYVASVRIFAEWLLETRPRITGVEDDFIETLYKLLGTQIGGILAEYYLSARSIGLPDERLEELDRFLSSGI